MRSLLFAVMLALAAPVMAQQSPEQTASLVADSVTFARDTGELSAQGNVEVLQDGVRLRAQSIRYNGETDRLVVTGPIYITDPSSDTVIAAEFAELSGDLRDGVLRSARVVYAQQLQLAAVELRRTEGRYTQLYKTVASSCHICENNPTPLWEIRSKRVVHDAEERQLYFDEATLRVLGVPVFYSPYLRLPDPSVERASGFLVPELRSNGDLGVGLRTPYFFTLGDHADLTLTPWLTSKGAKTLEARYRQKFRFGEIDLNGAVTDDNVANLDSRGYLFAEGSFVLPRGFTGKFDVELTSDQGYLLLYGFSDKDRLDSAISVERARRDEYIGAELIHYKSLRDEDDNKTIPTIVGDASYIKRFSPALLGGIATLTAETHGHFRRADDDPTNEGLSRDVVRLTTAAEWRRDWVMGNGMLLAVDTALYVDAYKIRQPRPDPVLAFDDQIEVTPYAAIEWRWPMLRQGARARHLLEPVVQLVITKDQRNHVDNEDSLLVEFDEANIFEFSRFPGADQREQGNRLNLGVTYTRLSNTGWSLGLTVGRILRDDDLSQFSGSTGLTGSSSDWLVAAQLKVGERFDLINRAVFDDQFSFARNEMRMSWTGDRHRLGSTFAWLEADTSEGRDMDTSELAIDGAYRVSRHWTLSSELRYDFVNDRTTRAGVGVSYQNECAKMDLSVSRRFTSSTSVSPTTDLNLSVQLAGFGARGIGGTSFARQCNG
ncbi:LPS-assembly protein [Litoreibacter ponti]|uniref:LPS-assembly protein LptD n=1 Tax=Litoreibacter ponti TaxID=1510457 RepID=A0A2T6BI01_9RHOB|nr:LPS assembly protein LptD [Litoreibacter ponti]PTX55691.1 LPS-assembly protein [Litoreibacter ponti]